MTLSQLSLIIVLLPLFSAAIAGLPGRHMPKKLAHYITIGGVSFAFLGALLAAKLIYIDNVAALNHTFFTWGMSGQFSFEVGFLIDRLSVVMLLVVTFVSLLVHVYSIGYMAEDKGYQRFFSYISFFTFAMLTLVLANNFLVLFFGWEGVGLASYLLIGFWYQRDSATAGSLKAFLVNRVGDFGFLLGMAALLDNFGTLDYIHVFREVPGLVQSTITWFPGVTSSTITLICLLLFIGAMGKSAQVPLHVWLPESMEGPTLISALIHAATMVTAGIYMVSRMSPLFEYSEVALHLVLVIGATGALLLGLLALVQHDIKRVIAYSTLSQLGYMVAALGASAYSASIFHLVTHACFKALLFLAAGSVIMGMHHDQDLRHMGGLRKYMPITHLCFLIGALSLSAIPPFSGFYSKDAIIEAVGQLGGLVGTYAYGCVLFGSFLTAAYSFRCFFLAFYGKERMSAEQRAHAHESPNVVWIPLVILAVPSIFLGWLLIEPLLFTSQSLLGDTITVLPQHTALHELGAEFHGAFAMMLHAVTQIPFWLALAGVVVTFVLYIKKPHWPARLAQGWPWFYRILINKYGFDAFNEKVFIRGAKALAQVFYKITDLLLIDGIIVNGSGRLVRYCSVVMRRLQTGYLYHYAFAMIMGLLALLVWLLVK